MDSFSELMRRVSRGDGDALEMVLADYGEAIQREIRFTLLDSRLRRFVGESDVYQSVVLRFFAGMRAGNFQLETPAELVGLLKCIARTRVAELVRFWRAKRRSLDRTPEIEEGTLSETLAKGLAPDRRLETAELAAFIAQRLTPRDSQILQLRDDGLNWTEIAARLGSVSPEAIRKQHTRALARIAADLDRGHENQ